MRGRRTSLEGQDERGEEFPTDPDAPWTGAELLRAAAGGGLRRRSPITVPVMLMVGGEPPPSEAPVAGTRRRKNGPDPADLATPDDVRAERARRRAAGLPYGYRPVAKALGISPSTVRRRLGVM